MNDGSVQDDGTKIQRNLVSVGPFKAGMLVMLFSEKNVMLTDQFITNYTLTMSTNAMTWGVDSESS